MLDRLKKWLKEMFAEDSKAADSDLSENRLPHQDIHSSPSSSQSVRTKMSFKYPEQTSFQFPRMPEYSGGSPRKENRPVRKRMDVKEDKDDELYKTQDYETPEKIQKNIRANFQPTDVPSPIYGFQKRKSEDTNDQIDEIPAYKRRNETNYENVHDLKAEKNKHRSDYTDLKEERASDKQMPQGTPTSEIHKNIIPFQARKNRETTSPPDPEDKPGTRQEQSREEQSREPIRKSEEKMEDNERKEEDSGSFQFTSRPKSARPFNVMMTPSDKRKLQQHQQTGEEQGEKHLKADGQGPGAPPLHLLNDLPVKAADDTEWLESQQQKLETTLNQFKVRAQVTNVKKGPSVTRFEVQPDVGVKVNKFTNLTDDIKLNLAAQDIRMEAPIPGKSAIGIEVPNQQPKMVSMLEILQDDTFQNHSSDLAVGLGQDIEGEAVVTDLKKMPHGLIAGATGSGKSVCINTVLVSLLYKASYEDVKFLLIDPKVVELAPYNDLPHLVAPVITDVKAATASLKWAVSEMEDRYEKFAAEGVRDIDRFNEKIKKDNRESEKMPYIIIVIDELADLMMVSPQDVEDSISRIAQKARACGIHLLLATQRPSVDVITGLIKANIPTRIAFSVSSQVDSRTIIDLSGAEKLLGKGDMLFLPNGSGKTRRIQGAFVSDEEVERVTSYVKKQASPQYLFEQEDLIQHNSLEEHEDDLLNEAIELVVDEGRASTSLLQRKMSIGYNRAARMIDRMEEIGLISAQNGSKPREVLMNQEQAQEVFLNK
ncbi:DNA translocase FtsK [Virgibacillus sp. MSP4-1]|uniref:DNA translocase FtsK n=1 Tax=Virgibacillus sp. MSP4-1 TaxID=2700081 RepID=UPI0003A132BA|nr:DNA translocase FtsK [Virgibacillus sp. MSP4-1]QHS23055.1 DNA translocase FtsK [Virgibacillus sp. MSP4-1]